MKDQTTIKLGIAIVIAALLGCGAVKKQKDCSELIKKANAALTEIQAIDTASGDPGTLRQLADTAEKHATALSETEISDEELKGYANTYVQMWRDMATHSRALADAAEKKDLAALNAASEKLKAATAQESALVDSMNKSCSRE